MKVYTRIEKHKDRSKPTGESYYDATSAQKSHRGLFIFAGILLLALLVTGAYCFLSKENNRSSNISGTKTISQSIVQTNPEIIPQFSRFDYVELNENKPSFTQDDYELIDREFYSPLDALGRCGVVYANIDATMRPTEERGSIGMIKPSGWKQAKYEGYIDSKPPYLYN